jgi:hypothetical protein
MIRNIPAAVTARLPFGDLLMDILVGFLAGAQWLPYPMPCNQCRTDVQVVRRAGHARFLCLGCTAKESKR